MFKRVKVFKLLNLNVLSTTGSVVFTTSATYEHFAWPRACLAPTIETKVIGPSRALSLIRPAPRPEQKGHASRLEQLDFPTACGCLHGSSSSLQSIVIVPDAVYKNPELLNSEPTSSRTDSDAQSLEACQSIPGRCNWPLSAGPGMRNGS